MAEQYDPGDLPVEPEGERKEKQRRAARMAGEAARAAGSGGRATFASQVARTVRQSGERAGSAVPSRGEGERAITSESGRALDLGTTSFYEDGEAQEEILYDQNIPACSAALLEDVELMGVLSSEASRAADEGEAASLVAAAVPLALRQAPHVYRALWPVLPSLVEGTAALARSLHGRSATRPLIARIPALLQRVVEELAQRVMLDRPVSSRVAARVLARHTEAFLDAARRARRRPRPRSDVYEAEWWGNGHNR